MVHKDFGGVGSMMSATRLSGVMDRTRKESLLGSSGVGVSEYRRLHTTRRLTLVLGTAYSVFIAWPTTFDQLDSSIQVRHRLIVTVVGLISRS